MLHEPMTLLDTATLTRFATACLYCPAEVVPDLGGTGTGRARYWSASTRHRCPECGGRWLNVWSGCGRLDTLTVRDTFWPTPPAHTAAALRRVAADLAALEHRTRRLRADLKALLEQTDGPAGSVPRSGDPCTLA